MLNIEILCPGTGMTDSFYRAVPVFVADHLKKLGWDGPPVGVRVNFRCLSKRAGMVFDEQQIIIEHTRRTPTDEEKRYLEALKESVLAMEGKKCQTRVGSNL
jgi:hypothetical protein